MPNLLVLTTIGSVLAASLGPAISLLIRWRRKSRENNRNTLKPLGEVVAKCEARWLLEDLKLAVGGDVQASARLGHMLESGFGTRQESSDAAQWIRDAWAIQNFKEPAMPCSSSTTCPDKGLSANQGFGGSASPQFPNDIPSCLFSVYQGPMVDLDDDADPSSEMWTEDSSCCVSEKYSVDFHSRPSLTAEQICRVPNTLWRGAVSLRRVASENVLFQ